MKRGSGAKDHTPQLPEPVVCGLRSFSSQASECRLISCGTWAQLPHSTWDLPRPVIKPSAVSLALQGRFLTTGPPGKPRRLLFSVFFLKQPSWRVWSSVSLRFWFAFPSWLIILGNFHVLMAIHVLCSQKCLFKFLVLFFFLWLYYITYRIVVPWTGIKPAPPAVEECSVNYWSTREVPLAYF